MTAIERPSFSSADEGRGHESFRSVWVGNRSTFLRVGEHPRFGVQIAAPGCIDADRVRSTVDSRSETEPLDLYAFLAVNHGHLRVRWDHEEAVLPVGSVSLLPVGVGLDIELVDGGVSAVRLPMDPDSPMMSPLMLEELTGLTLSDIAAVAGSTGRALQYAFRHQYDTTPLGYAHWVRLERAHRELQTADPAAGDTVRAVAARWGYAKPDRFDRAYRQAFGHPPSRTLRSEGRYPT